MSESMSMARCGQCSILFRYHPHDAAQLLKCHTCGAFNRLRPASGPRKQRGNETRLPPVAEAPPPLKTRASVQFEKDMRKAMQLSAACQPGTQVPNTSADDDIRVAIELSLQEEQMRSYLNSSNDAAFSQALAQSLEDYRNQRDKQNMKARHENELLNIAIANSLASAQAKLLVSSSDEGSSAPQIQKRISQTIKRITTEVDSVEDNKQVDESDVVWAEVADLAALIGSMPDDIDLEVDGEALAEDLLQAVDGNPSRP